jgi:hypothetical protein
MIPMHPFYKSHKFWTVVSALLALVVSVITGEATVTQITGPAIALILGYFGIRVVEAQVKK